MYYLQSRYYDPTTCRFINADSFVFADQDILGNNTFAYCCNNPIFRIDETGHWFFDIFWDVVSFVVSVVEVVQNPTDVGAWVGLAMDAVDVLVPCVSGLGEATDAVNATRKAVDAADDLHDAKKVVENTTETAQTLHRPYIRKSTRDAVETSAKRAPDGRFLDANTGIPIDGKHDLGHQYGHEFWRERQKAEQLGWSQKQFNDYMNNPDFYRVEDPSLNRSHKFEMP